MNFSKLISVVLTFFAAVVLLAAELKVTPQQPWQSVKTESGNGEFVIKYPGTGWPALSFTAPVMPGRHYQISWQMKSSIADTANPVQLAIDTGAPMVYGYPVTGGWGSYSAFFFSDKSVTAKCRIFINPGPAKEMAVRNLKITEVSPESFAENLLPNGDFEADQGGPVLWTKSYGTERYPARIVENQDFLAGSRSLVINFAATSANSEGLTSIYLPVLPGKKFELSFWAKADRENVLNASAEIWSPVKHTGKHFYKTGSFKLSDNWRKYEVILDIPANVADYPDLQCRLIRLKLSGVKSAGYAVSVDNIVFRQIK